MDKLLEIKNLSVGFLTDDTVIRAVNEIGFVVNKGETVGIVGESGSGKTVTALSVMRLISSPGRIYSGEIFFHSNGAARDLIPLSEVEMRNYRGNRMGMIFQEPMTSLNPVFTCGEQVAEAIIAHKRVSKRAAREKTISLFEKVRLPQPDKIFEKYPHQLSGGQKQRVMISMAISCDPDLLIADEPTTALDVTIQKSILELLSGLQKENNMGMIFISHDLGVIAEIADRVVVMYKGKIVEQGSVQEIFGSPRHPYTKGLLACRPPVNKKLRLLPTLSDFMRLNDDGSYSEVNKSVDDAINRQVITKEETEIRQSRLYQQEPVLKVVNLKKYFPLRKGVFGNVTEYVKAVDDVSFEVYPGETLGLAGESGCGKTTLGRLLVRLLEPASGEIFFRQTDFLGLEGKALRKMRKHIQIIFQDPFASLNPRMPIGEAILEPMAVHRIYPTRSERKAKTIELLEQVGMKEEHYKRYPHELSVGQRQRVCIARALSVQPEFIICDEPVSALDVSVQAQVLNLLNDLKRDFSFSMIFISHDLSVVKFMSDRIMVMHNGKIEETGLAEDVYSSPKSDYTKRLIDAIPSGKPPDHKSVEAP